MLTDGVDQIHAASTISNWSCDSMVKEVKEAVRELVYPYEGRPMGGSLPERSPIARINPSDERITALLKEYKIEFQPSRM